jgi:hypothetical protein
MMSGEVTSIVITAQIQTSGTVAYTYATNGPLSGNERTGARLVDGTVVTLEEAGVTQVEVPPVLEPTPVEPEPEPTPDPVVEPEPDTTPPVVPDIVIVQPPIIIPIPFEPPLVEEIVAEEPSVIVEEPPVVIEEPTPEPEPEPVEEEQPPVEEEQPPMEEEPLVEEELEVVQADEINLETLAPETPVQLDNGVVLEAGTVVALQLLENPAELISAIFDNPAEVLTAISNIGADMSEEERTASENTIIASVIATQAAVNAVAVASTTTTRTVTPTPTSGGTSVPSNDNIKLYKRRKP